GTRIDVGPLYTSGHPGAPNAAFDLRQGTTINTTQTGSPAFLDLALRVGTDDGPVTNDGAAFYAVSTDGPQVSQGRGCRHGVLGAVAGGPLGCGDGSVSLPPPAPVPTPSITSTPTPNDTPSASPSPSPSPSPSTETSTSTHTNPPPPPPTST